MCRAVVFAALVMGVTGCAALKMKPDPYSLAVGGVAPGASGVPDVRCACKPGTGPARGFSGIANKVMMRYANPDHRGVDMISTSDGEQVLSGKLAYGIVDKDLEGEPIELFACMGGDWQRVGITRTNGDGRFSYPLHGAARLPSGLRDLYASVVADRSGARFLAYVAPRGTRVIVTDIDGTLTSNETAFIGGIVGRGVGVHENAASALRAAAERGYQIVYVTARGDRFTDDTRWWLGTNDFPRGPLRLAPDLITMPGAATAAYKKRVLGDLEGFAIAAGIGNRNSDVTAYTAAGIPANRIFIKLPEYRGELATSLTGGAAVGFGSYMPLPL